MKAAVPMTPRTIRVVTPVIEERASPQHHTATRSKKIFTTPCSQARQDDARAKAMPVRVIRSHPCHVESRAKNRPGWRKIPVALTDPESIGRDAAKPIAEPTRH